MQTMITLSLMLNILVLVPVCTGLITNAKWAHAAYGEFSAARGILLSVYLSIGLLSALLLLVADPNAVAALLLVQVVYKVITPLTVGTIRNPVIISNLFIAAFHAATLTVIWNARA